MPSLPRLQETAAFALSRYHSSSKGVFELSMVWRGTQDNYPAERWLRSLVKMFTGDPGQL